MPEINHSIYKASLDGSSIVLNLVKTEVVKSGNVPGFVKEQGWSDFECSLLPKELKERVFYTGIRSAVDIEATLRRNEPVKIHELEVIHL